MIQWFSSGSALAWTSGLCGGRCVCIPEARGTLPAPPVENTGSGLCPPSLAGAKPFPGAMVTSMLPPSLCPSSFPWLPTASGCFPRPTVGWGQGRHGGHPPLQPACLPLQGSLLCTEWEIFRPRFLLVVLRKGQRARLCGEPLPGAAGLRARLQGNPAPLMLGPPS
ncbi:hypothetical protein HJG60_009518 [Phyllostomus discolor]|uniref:Uncharacterized protein n=1 Tax=Phyllostomus discolor TaxID=89673 RepID=A0A833YLG7_9CHIR|nr:hypothetical protein HJG60_009518 [Phyllostomus discolor]